MKYKVIKIIKNYESFLPLESIKSFLRITNSKDDTLISDIRSSVLDFTENFLNKSVIEREVYCNVFRIVHGAQINVPVPENHIIFAAEEYKELNTEGTETSQESVSVNVSIKSDDQIKILKNTAEVTLEDQTICIIYKTRLSTIITNLLDIGNACIQCIEAIFDKQNNLESLDLLKKSIHSHRRINI